MTNPADPAALPQCAVAVDLVVLTVREGQLCVLTVRRGIPPFRGRFALPGGFVLPDEGLEAAAYRELAEEAGLAREAVTLEQLRTFGEPKRDPRGRVVSVAYLALGAGLPDPLGGSDASSAQFEPVSGYLAHPAQLADGELRRTERHPVTGVFEFGPGPFDAGREDRRVVERQRRRPRGVREISTHRLELSG